jgi:hypothetical protein
MEPFDDIQIEESSYFKLLEEQEEFLLEEEYDDQSFAEYINSTHDF